MFAEHIGPPGSIDQQTRSGGRIMTKQQIERMEKTRREPMPAHMTPQAFWARFDLISELLGIDEGGQAQALGITVRRMGNWRRKNHYPALGLGLLDYCDQSGISIDWLTIGDISRMPKWLRPAIVSRSKVISFPRSYWLRKWAMEN